MSDKEKIRPATVIETQVLWGVEFREGEEYPWKEIGTKRDDSAATLRVYDYGCEHHPHLKHRITRTDVTVQDVDPEMLRKRLKEETAAEDPATVQSD